MEYILKCTSFHPWITKTLKKLGSDFHTSHPKLFWANSKIKTFTQGRFFSSTQRKCLRWCVLLATNHLRVLLSGLPFQWNLSFCDSCFVRGVLLLHFSGLGPEICFLYPFSQGHGSRSLLGLKNSLPVKFSFSTLSLWVYSMPCFIARSVICSKRFFKNVFLPF